MDIRLVASSASLSRCVQGLEQIYIFDLLGSVPRRGISGSYGKSMLNLLEKQPESFPDRLHHFTFLPKGYEGFCFSMSLPALGVTDFLILDF